MQNVETIIRRMRSADRSLDVGAWHRPINAATHVLDINDYETRLTALAWDVGTAARGTKETWIQRDICDHEPWPFPDNYFDYVTCSHVLEDIRDPVWVVSELSRVARAGYIECPSPAYELLAATGLSRRASLVGNAHHRWFVEMRQAEQAIRFRIKPHDLLPHGRYVPYTRLHCVNYRESVAWLFWEDQVSAAEIIFDVGEWIDRLLPDARALVSFRPLTRVRDKLSRIRSSEPVLEQPAHGDGVKYPYL